MKKKWIVALLLLGLLASLAACSTSKDTAQTTTADTTAADTADTAADTDAASDAAESYADSINIMVYPDYVSEDVLAAFEQEYGIQVNITYLSYEEDNITRLKVYLQ